MVAAVVAAAGDAAAAAADTAKCIYRRTGGRPQASCDGRKALGYDLSRRGAAAAKSTHRDCLSQRESYQIRAVKMAKSELKNGKPAPQESPTTKVS